MNVIDAPKILSHPNGKIDVKMGTLFEMVCETIGNPLPIITWKIKGEPAIDEDNNRRRLIEVRNRDMSGTIECIATNGVGLPAKTGIDMIVQCKYKCVV